MTDNILTKVLIGFVGALIAIFLKVSIDYGKKIIELNRIKKVLVYDLYHQLVSSAYFRKELEKLNNIYLKGLNSLNTNERFNFQKTLQETLFDEVFFSKETFNTILKQDLLRVLKKDPKSFGEIHNIYHITNKLQPLNTPYYESLFEEHLMSYSKSINKNDSNQAIIMALNFITKKIKADIDNTEMLTNLTYQYLIKLVGENKLKTVYGIELKKIHCITKPKRNKGFRDKLKVLSL